jgi:SAM-dependent methyltransferase
MPETAATDPYTQCGMRKMVCISRFDDFSLHHLPNAYCGKLGLAEELARLEITKLLALADMEKASIQGPLFKPCALHDSDFRNKPFYEKPRQDVLAAVPDGTRSVLSIGCGCGATEAVLVKGGMKVTAVPLDEVVAATASARGIETLPPDFDAAAALLSDRQFDCILMLDILQQLADPVTVLTAYRSFLVGGGLLLVSVPNCHHPGFLRRQSSGGRAATKTVQHTTLRRTRGWLRRAGYRHLRDHGIPAGRAALLSKWTFGLANGLLCRKLLLSARSGSI